MSRSIKFQVQRMFALICVFAVATLSGCDTGNLNVANKKIPIQSEAEIESSAKSETSVTPTSPVLETSPADVSTKLPPADASPSVVCEKFLDLLRSGNRLTAENLLTRSALAVTSRADLSIEPIGGPAAKYSFGEPAYATNKQKLAQVKCTITDEIDGEAYETNLTWLARKQKEGWRISGMIVQFEEGGPADLLSFESYGDVLKIKSSLSDAETEVGANAKVAQEQTHTSQK